MYRYRTPLPQLNPRRNSMHNSVQTLHPSPSRDLREPEEEEGRARFLPGSCVCWSGDKFAPFVFAERGKSGVPTDPEFSLIARAALEEMG